MACETKPWSRLSEMIGAPPVPASTGPEENIRALLPDNGLVPLQSILCTEELNKRPSRQPDYAAENAALKSLVQALADSPGVILQTLADTILKVFKADSAGLSLLTKDGKRFYWPAIAGGWQPHTGGGTPREFGPCGDVLDCNAPLLFKHWERRYPYLVSATPPANEGLLVPFYVKGKAVGTIWAIAHSEHRKFDAEDMRQLQSLAQFASSAYQAIVAREALAKSATDLVQGAVQLDRAEASRDLAETVIGHLQEEIMAREEAEEIAARQAAELEILYESAAVGLFFFDTQLRFVRINQVMAEINGLTIEQHLGLSLREIVVPGLADTLEPLLRQVLETGRPILEYEVHGATAPRADEPQRHWLVSYHRAEGRDGTITGLHGVVVEITGRKHAEEQLQLSEQNLAAELAATRLLHQVSTQLIQAENVEELYGKILDTLVTIMRSDFSSLQMFHPERGELRLVGFRGFTAQAAKDWEWVKPTGESTCGIALRTGQRCIVPDVLKCKWMTGSAGFETYFQAGIHALQSTPLFSHSGAVVGVITTHWHEPHDPSASELRLLDVLARQAADLIERKQAEDALRVSEDMQSFLLTLSDEMRPLTEPKEIGWLAAERLAEQLSANRVFYAEVVGTVMTVERDCTRGVRSIVGAHDLKSMGPELIGNYQGTAVITIRNLATDPRAHDLGRKELHERQIGAFIDVVLFDEDQCVTILAVQNATPRNWTSAEESLVRNVGERVRSAIERAWAEAAVRESEERYRALTTASSDVIYRMNADWSEIRHLDGRDFLVSSGEPNANWLQEYIHPDDQSQVVAVINESIRTKTVFQLEHRVRQVDGTVGWTFSRAVPQLNAQGEILEWFGAATDVTERKRAEEAVREGSERLEQALSAGRLGSWRWDSMTDVVELTDRAAVIFGLPLNELTTWAKMRSLLHEEDQAPTKAAVEKSAADHSDYDVEYRIIRPSGTEAWISAKGLGIYAKDGAVIGMTGVVQDITEQKRGIAESALAREKILESEERYRTLFASAPMAVFSCDKNAVIQHYNQRAVELWGRQPECGVEKHCGSVKLWLPNGAFLPHEQSPMMEVLRTGIPALNVEAAIERPDGARLPVLVSFAALKNEQGEITGAITSFIDITERKRAEQHAEMLVALSRELASAATEAAIVKITVDAVGRHLNGHRCYFVECLEKENRLLHSYNWVRDDAPSIGGELSLFDFGGVEWWRQFAGGDFFIEDVTTNPLTEAKSANYQAVGVLSYAVQPFRREGDWTVALVVTESSPRKWTAYDLQVLSDVVARVWPQVERARADEELCQSEERYRNLFNSVDEGVSLIEVIFDENEKPIDFRFLEVNPAFKKQTGMHDVEGKRVRDINPAHEDHWFEMYGRVVKTGESIRYVNEAKQLGRWIDIYACRVGGPGSHKVAVVSNDITARQKTEAAMRHQAALLLTISDAATQLLNADSPLTLLDGIFRRLARVLGAEYYFNYLLRPDGTALVLESNGGLLDGQHAACAEWTLAPGESAAGAGTSNPIVRDMGAICAAQAAALGRTLGAGSVAFHPLHTSGRMLGTFGVASSSRSPFSADEVRFISTLCDLVAASIERARLIHDVRRARDLSDQANVAKDMFLASLSHELRTPLSPVLLLAGEAINNPATTAADREIFTTIVKNVELEARLIDDLLDVTRINSGKLALDLQVVDLHAVLADAIETVRAELLEKKIVLKLELAAERPFLRGDPVRLQQVFWNVLRNAGKFSPSCSEIAVESLILPSGFLRIAIIDHGVGITKAELTRLFTSFSQGDHAAGGGSHRFGGLGLGLSISRRLVELHGGTIRAESEGLNQGATFIVEFPLNEDVRNQHRLETSAPPARQLTPLPRKPTPLRRILLAEDHEPTRVAMTHLLVRRGFEVVSVASLAEARAAASRTTFNLLISDLGLPDGSGNELMAELRARFGLNGIALTGYGREEDVSNSLAAGFVVHLTKPVSIERLENALEMIAAIQEKAAVSAAASRGSNVIKTTSADLS